MKPFDAFSKDKKGKYGYQYSCKECVKEYQKDNKEKIKEYKKQYRQDNKEKIRKQNAQYHKENREERLEWQKKYRQNHKEEISEYNKQYQRNRRVNDVAFALRNNVSTAIWKALNRNDGSKAGESVMKYLPYTIDQLWEHLRSLYTEGMTDENYGEWEIDHIIAQSLLPFDSMDHPNFLKCWALDNLQPLWAEDNLRKGNKIL